MRPVAVVTGAAGGLGQAIAARLGELGYEVVGLSRSTGVDVSDERAVVDHREHELRWHGDITAPHLILDRDGERAGGDVGRGLDPI